MRGIATDEEVEKFIKETVTCRMPLATESPMLSYLVRRFQMHNCGFLDSKKKRSTCLRTRLIAIGRHGQKLRRTKFCRFGFPRAKSDRFKLLPVPDPTKVQNGPVQKMYQLERRDGEEIYVNDYVPSILYAWGAKLVLKFVGNNLTMMTLSVWTASSLAQRRRASLDMSRSTRPRRTDKRPLTLCKRSSTATAFVVQ